MTEKHYVKIVKYDEKINRMESETNQALEQIVSSDGNIISVVPAPIAVWTRESFEKKPELGVRYDVVIHYSVEAGVKKE